MEAVKAGFIDLMLAGGTESMSNAPYLLKGARWGYRMGNAEVVDSMLQEGLTCAIEGLSHGHDRGRGQPKRYGVSRADQDAFAAESQRRAEQRGELRRLRSRDRPGRRCRSGRGRRCASTRTSTRAPARRPRSSAALQAGVHKDGTVTAGNASGINDGAAALVVATAKKAEDARHASRWRASSSYCTTGVDPMIMGMGPVEAMRKAARPRRPDARRSRSHRAQRGLRRRSRSPSSASSGSIRAKVNVHGGAIALGHPIGASGARMLTTLVHALQARGGGRGAASLCIGGGMGTAMIVEAVAAFDARHPASARVRAEIVAHAREDAPRECCGLLVGHGSLVLESVRSPNVDPDPNRYEIDARVHVATNRRLRGTGRAVVGAYHSHPHSPAWPSASDLAEAYYAEFIWVIVSLASGVETLKAFRLDGAVSWSSRSTGDPRSVVRGPQSAGPDARDRPRTSGPRTSGSEK